MTLYCVMCRDPFDVDETVRADQDTPLCSDLCLDSWARLMQHESDYRSAGDAAPVF